jgi:hypothetical protein
LHTLFSMKYIFSRRSISKNHCLVLCALATSSGGVLAL